MLQLRQQFRTGKIVDFPRQRLPVVGNAAVRYVELPLRVVPKHRRIAKLAQEKIDSRIERRPYPQRSCVIVEIAEMHIKRGLESTLDVLQKISGRQCTVYLLQLLHADDLTAEVSDKLTHKVLDAHVKICGKKSVELICVA